MANAPAPQGGPTALATPWVIPRKSPFFTVKTGFLAVSEPSEALQILVGGYQVITFSPAIFTMLTYEPEAIEGLDPGFSSQNLVHDTDILTYADGAGHAVAGDCRGKNPRVVGLTADQIAKLQNRPSP
jgi:hypothetical protein